MAMSIKGLPEVVGDFGNTRIFLVNGVRNPHVAAMIRLPAAASGRFASACVHALFGAALALAVAADPAGAQEQPEDPPYEQDLMRLSEILGALHYLRPLCGHPDGSLWRDEMQALLEAEVQDDSRKRRFIERFNQGYRGFSSVYRGCTPAAELTLSRYVSEAGSIVRNVTTRYNR